MNPSFPHGPAPVRRLSRRGVSRRGALLLLVTALAQGGGSGPGRAAFGGGFDDLFEDGRPAALLRAWERNADALGARHRVLAERAAGREDWRQFAAHLRLHALHDIAAARRALPPAVERDCPRTPLVRLPPEPAAGEAPAPLDPLFAAVPALRGPVGRSPTLRAALTALYQPPRGTERLRVDSVEPFETVAAHYEKDGELVLQFSARLSSPPIAPGWAGSCVIFELCNMNYTVARRTLWAAVARREVTRSQYVGAAVLLERIANAEAQLVAAAVLEADGMPFRGPPLAFARLGRFRPPSPPRGWFPEIRTDGYPWAWYGLYYERQWVSAWSRKWHSTPTWPVWVAVHRAPAYAQMAHRDGPGPFIRHYTPQIKRQARRRLLYRLLDALPEPWARRFYMTPGVEWLDAPDLYAEAVAAERR